MNLDDFRQWSTVYNAMINPNEDLCHVHDGVEALYTVGGRPEGHNGLDDPGQEPEWAPLYVHLFSEMMVHMHDQGVELEDPEFSSVSMKWLAEWIETTSVKWKNLHGQILDSANED